MLRKVVSTVVYGGAGAAAVATTGSVIGLWGGTPDEQPFLAETVPSRAQQLSRIQTGSAEKPFDLLVIGGKEREGAELCTGSSW